MKLFLTAIRVAESIETGVIRKRDDEYCVESEKNPEWSGGCYPSKEKAEKRLQQVEMWKSLKSKK